MIEIIRLLKEIRDELRKLNMALSKDDRDIRHGTRVRTVVPVTRRYR